MREIYHFGIAKITRQSTQSGIHQHIAVDVSGSTLNKMVFFIDFKECPDKKRLLVDKVKLWNHYTPKQSPDERAEHLLSYLTGYFHFKSIEDLEFSINDLKDRLNWQDREYKTFSTRWFSFAVEFEYWFEEITACLQEDYKLYKFYFKKDDE